MNPPISNTQNKELLRDAEYVLKQIVSVYLDSLTAENPDATAANAMFNLAANYLDHKPE